MPGDYIFHNYGGLLSRKDENLDASLRILKQDKRCMNKMTMAG